MMRCSANIKMFLSSREVSATAWNRILSDLKINPIRNQSKEPNTYLMHYTYGLTTGVH